MTHTIVKVPKTTGLFLKNGEPYGRFTWRGRQYERSLTKLFPERKLSGKTEQLNALADMKTLVRTGKLLDTPAPSGTFADYLDKYQAEWCEKPQNSKPPQIEYNPNGTVLRGSALLSNIQVAKRALGKYSLVQLADSHLPVKEFLDTVGKGKGPHVRNRHMALLKHFFSYAIDYDWGIELSPFRKKRYFVPGIELPRTRRLSPTEELALKGVIDDPILWARIRMALKCGLRRGEILKTPLKQFDFKHWTVQLRRADVKNAESAQKVTIEDPELREFLNSRRFLGPDSYPFGDIDGKKVRGFQKAWTSALTNAFGPDDVDLHFHDLRAECCSRLLESGKPIEIVARILRDSIETVQKHYKRLQESLDAMRKAMKD